MVRSRRKHLSRGGRGFLHGAERRVQHRERRGWWEGGDRVLLMRVIGGRGKRELSDAGVIASAAALLAFLAFLARIFAIFSLKRAIG
jgi:hypothetical protein